MTMKPNEIRWRLRVMMAERNIRTVTPEIELSLKGEMTQKLSDSKRCHGLIADMHVGTLDGQEAVGILTRR